jgi:NAD(P)-dependent dehydrogenase (short-subunit alcohol dehydrogenase family)
MHFQGLALVIGAPSGIGRASAEALAATGARVVLTFSIAPRMAQRRRLVPPDTTHFRKKAWRPRRREPVAQCEDLPTGRPLDRAA